MIDSDKLLAIGDALVRVVRNKIKYSENLDLLYSQTSTSGFFYKKNREGLVYKNLHNIKNCPKRGLLALKYGIGYCDELCLAILCICQYLSLTKIGICENEEPIFVSIMDIIRGPHAFILIHQSESLHEEVKSRKRENEGDRYLKPICNNINELIKYGNLDNSVLVDPWIYKSTKLEDIDKHLMQAKAFGVYKKFYTNKIAPKGFSVDISIDAQEIPDQYADMLNTHIQEFYLLHNQTIKEDLYSYEYIKNNLIAESYYYEKAAPSKIQKHYRLYKEKQLNVRTAYQGFKLDLDDSSDNELSDTNWE
jgi:hypothetical protein